MGRFFECARQSLELAAPDAVTATAPEPPASWKQCAYEGAWKGNAQGAFKFGRADLEQMVTNFRASKAYKAGAVTASRADIEAGKFDVTPVDWRHLGEMHPGASAMTDQVAQGWNLELEVRDGADPKTGQPQAQLWSFMRLLEPARSLVSAQKIKWLSVTALPNVKDSVTAANRGWVLSSIALTNRPFLEGMVALEQARVLEAGFALDFNPYARPDGPEECVDCLRDMFGLKTNAETAEVLTELAKLKAWALGHGEPPAGVAVAKQVGQLRRLFNLRTNASRDEIFAEADRLIADLAAAATATPTTAGSPANVTLEAGDPTMPLTPALLALLKRHGITVATPDDEPSVIIALEQRLQEGASAVADRTALFGAFGDSKPKTVAEAGAVLAEALGAAANYKALLPRIEAAELAGIDQEEQLAGDDIARTLAHYKLPKGAEGALILARTGGKAKPAATATPDQRRTFLLERSTARTSFFSRYPAPEGEERHLSVDYFGTGPTAAARAAVERRAAAGGQGGGISLEQGGPGVGIGGGDHGAFTLEQTLATYHAPNRHGQAMEHIKATDKTRNWNDGGNYTELCKRAGDLLRTNNLA